jgi:uncharacterized membrane protein
MPNIAYWHPQIVHFVVALSMVGVGARVVSLLLPSRGRAGFIGPMATTLILLAALASVPAVQSGMQAHGPAERVPGARPTVQEHEEAGVMARNLLLGLAALEIAGLFLAGRPKVAKAVHVLAALAGLATLYQVYDASREGGEVVYSYAGNVGLRSGEDADLKNLLTAGLYHNAMKAREDGNKQEAARWIDELSRTRPGDRDLTFLRTESLLEDRADPRGTLAALDTMAIPAEDTRMLLRRSSLAARAYVALGQPDSGRALIEALKREHPSDARLQAMADRALQRLSGGGR